MSAHASYKRHSFESTYDTIVIGSGMGGLTTAALLAKHARERVLVLERHYTAGGFTHAFTRPGFEWDVGLHYVGEVSHPKAPLRRFFDHLTEGRLEWADMGDVYDRIEIDGRVYPFMKGKDALIGSLSQAFPKSSREIARYIELCERAAARAQPYFAETTLPGPIRGLFGGALRYLALRHARKTTHDVLSELTNDVELRGVLAGQWGDYGLPPKQSSFLIHALVVNHYLRGGAYPVGGASRIADCITPVITRHGGAIVVRAEVDEILVERNRAIGVRMVDGREIRAKRIVSNAGVALTFNELVPKPQRAKLRARFPTEGIAPSLAHLSLYVGLDQPDHVLGLTKANRWIFPGPDHDANLAAFERDRSATLPVAFLSFPSAKDPDFQRRHPGHATVEVISMAPYAWFKQWEGTTWGHRGEGYEALKGELTARLLDVLHRACPSLKGHVVHAELSTPLSTRHFAGHPHGEIYGLAHTRERFDAARLGPRTPIAGLYLTGADVCTAGVGGALFGGVLSASAILGGNLVGKVLASKEKFSPHQVAAQPSGAAE